MNTAKRAVDKMLKEMGATLIITTPTGTRGFKVTAGPVKFASVFISSGRAVIHTDYPRYAGNKVTETVGNNNITETIKEIIMS